MGRGPRLWPRWLAPAARLICRRSRFGHVPYRSLLGFACARCRRTLVTFTETT